MTHDSCPSSSRWPSPVMSWVRAEHPSLEPGTWRWPLSTALLAGTNRRRYAGTGEHCYIMVVVVMIDEYFNLLLTLYVHNS